MVVVLWVCLGGLLVLTPVLLSVVSLLFFLVRVVVLVFVVVVTALSQYCVCHLRLPILVRRNPNPSPKPIKTSPYRIAMNYILTN